MLISMNIMESIFGKQFYASFSGEIEESSLLRSIYATDASVYREWPEAVCYPKNEEDIRILINFAKKNQKGLIPRGAGTSLAGQCVGNGIIVDLSRHFNKILEINQEEGWARVQVGLVRDELNHQLRKYKLFFGPNTSTANRCTLGGMFGNNSSGTSSIRYGTTRDKTLEAKVFLHTSRAVRFTRNGVEDQGEKEEQIIEQCLNLGKENQLEGLLETHFPKKDIHRRNSGYALDSLTKEEADKNLLDILSGSEGTLGICTELKLKLDKLPPKFQTLVVPHFEDVIDCLEAVQSAMKSPLFACEMMDDIILECTASNPVYAPKRFFVNGQPKALLVLELRADSQSELEALSNELQHRLQSETKVNSISIVGADRAGDVWELRKAGLGLLANMKGNLKAVACIEDTAVSLDDLPQYIDDFTHIMSKFGQEAVYYAHAGAGEIHLRPILDLKTEKGRYEFRAISEAVALLVKKYKGSLSGEHGDGRVRAEFLPLVYGREIYSYFERLKKIWDPYGIFNPGKIVNAPPMDQMLRDEQEQTKQLNTEVLNEDIDLIRIADRCNGSGDCRKGVNAIGQMCPSYKASGHETDSTRARANAFREFHTEQTGQEVGINEEDLHHILKYCVSCKACAVECPSNVDMGLLKMVFEEHYYKKKGFSLKRFFYGHIHLFNKLGASFTGLSNRLISSSLGRRGIQQLLDIHPKRSLPLFKKSSLKERVFKPQRDNQNKEVVLVVDEFNRYNRPELFEKAIELLTILGYTVQLVLLEASGRALFSKSYLKAAAKKATANVTKLKVFTDRSIPILGLEPSALSCFWDEYPKLKNVDQKTAQDLRDLAQSLSTFIANEFNKGSFKPNLFDTQKRKIKLHSHCHEKAYGEAEQVALALSIPGGHSVEHINSACCGMAGSFGYEKENYDMSKKMAHLSLIPATNDTNSLIVAQGISCSHQIEDFTNNEVIHPVELLHLSLKKT